MAPYAPCAGMTTSPISGMRGKGRCQVHLLNEVSTEHFMPDVAKDLIPVCANCHGMLHSGFTKEDLAAMVRMNLEMKKLIR